MRQSDTYFRPTKSRISVSLYQPAESCLLVSGDESLIQAADTRFFGVVVCISFLYHTCIETYRCESLRKNRYQYMSHRRIKPVSNQLPPSYIYSLRIYTLCRQLPSLSPSFPHSPLAPYTSLVCPVYSSGLPAAPCLACLASDPSSSHARQISACAPAPTHPPCVLVWLLTSLPPMYSMYDIPVSMCVSHLIYVYLCVSHLYSCVSHLYLYV